MDDGSKQVSVTFDDNCNIVAIKVSGEDVPRDLNHPDGNLATQPMPIEEYDTLVGFQTVTVVAFKSAAGAKKTCVKLMNCGYVCF